MIELGKEIYDKIEELANEFTDAHFSNPEPSVYTAINNAMLIGAVTAMELVNKKR